MAIRTQIDDTITIRGIRFPVAMIHEVILETGGELVADEETTAALDAAMAEYLAAKGKNADTPKSIYITAYPFHLFVPKRILIHSGDPSLPGFDFKGKPTNMFLYFAVKRIFHA